MESTEAVVVACGEQTVDLTIDDCVDGGDTAEPPAVDWSLVDVDLSAFEVMADCRPSPGSVSVGDVSASWDTLLNNRSSADINVTVSGSFQMSHEDTTVVHSFSVTPAELFVSAGYMGEATHAKDASLEEWTVDPCSKCGQPIQVDVRLTLEEGVSTTVTHEVSALVCAG